jgi:hypothetical protein
MAMGSGGITLYGYVFSKITCTLKYVRFIPPVLLLVDQRSINVVYLIIILNLSAPTLLSLVGDPLSGNGCGSPNHIYVISVLLVALLSQFILDN